MRALLINLDRSPQRLAWMQAEFDRLGLEFERVTAIDGRDLSDVDMARHARPRLDGEIWTPPEIACFLSHRKCWQIVAEGDAEFCAIFEDDIHIGPEVAPLISDPSWIPAGADLPGICIQATVTPGYDGPLRSVISEVRVFPVAKKKYVRRDALSRILRELARPWKRAYRRLAARYQELRAPLIVFPTRQTDRGGGGL